MYGTVATFTIKPGAESDLKQLTGMENERSPEGAVFFAVYRLDSGNDEYILAVGFKDKESYVTNANAPEQHEFYVKFRNLLVADPVWRDGEIVDTMFA